MYHIRTTNTASKAKAVQIVRYESRKMIVVVHVGSAHSDEELLSLKRSANKWIEKLEKQCTLFPDSKSKLPNLIPFEKCRYLGIRYHFSYEVLTKIFARFGFIGLGNNLLNDLVLMRIIEPASKLRSLELMDQYFGIKYKRIEFYRSLSKFIIYEEKAKSKIMALAKRELNFNFSLVFYDVTTLYFESFAPDDLRKAGFSKDNKSNQPQIVIGLIVDANGFPVSYEIFPGNKFEGHTLIPAIIAFKNKYNISALTVVADAAMISQENIQALKDNGFFYIVGARIGNLSQGTIAKINQMLNQEDGNSLRIETTQGMMICNFSQKRYQKDKYEMEKQLTKAENLLKDPSRMKRTKFIKNQSGRSFELNKILVEKTKSLLGIKGYCTNLGDDINNQVIIDQYHNLWRIEQAFRIAKSDLEIRPVYHFKQEVIGVHILICFMALAVCKYLEIKTGKSIKYIIRLLQSVTDARILNLLTNDEFTMRSELNEDLKEMLIKLNLPY